MKKTNLATSFTKSKSFPLIIILVVMAVITAVVSHGRFFAAGNMLTVLYGMVIQIIMLCGLGLILISGSIAAGGLSLSGLLTAVASALFYAALIVFNKRIRRTSGLQTAALELDVAFLVVLLYVLVTSGLPHPARGDWPWLLLLGPVNTGFAYLLYFSGLQKLPAQSVALISYIDPVSALFFSAVFLHESMTALQLLGAVLILGGAIWGER